MRFQKEAERERDLNEWDACEFVRGKEEDGEYIELWMFTKKNVEKRDVYGIVTEYGGGTTYFNWIMGD